ncbi:MAG: hypothetical protein LBO79_07360 [Zoogloeaceae bacterium]|nr:hypothetical protein [Zoogloeaceae bacterium]
MCPGLDLPSQISSSSPPPQASTQTAGAHRATGAAGAASPASAARRARQDLQAEARRTPGLPPARQRAALREVLTRDLSALLGMRNRVGAQAWVMARAANLMDRLHAGVLGVKDALVTLEELRATLSQDGEDPAAGLESLDTVEREALAHPLRELARMAVEADRPEEAGRFREFSGQLRDAMANLRSGDADQAKAVFTQLLALQTEALVDDRLYAALPAGEADRLRGDLSATLQTLLQAASLRQELQTQATEHQARVDTFNAFSRAAETAAGGDFAAEAFQGAIFSLTDSAARIPRLAEAFQGERQGWEDNPPRTQREAMNLLHAIQEKLRDAGIQNTELREEGNALRVRLDEANRFQFTPSPRCDSIPIPIHLETARESAFLGRVERAGIERALQPGDPNRQNEWADLGRDMALLGIVSPYTEATFTQVANLRQTQGSATADSDTLRIAADQAREHLEKLGEGADKELLRGELASFDDFRTRVEQGIREIVTPSLDEAKALLEGSPGAREIAGMKASLDGALARMEQLPQAGTTLKGELRLQVDAMKNQLDLRGLQETLDLLKTGRDVPENLQTLMENSRAIPGARALIGAFSTERAGELRSEIAGLKFTPPLVRADVLADLQRLERQADRLLLKEDGNAIQSLLAGRRAELARALGEQAFGQIDVGIRAALDSARQQTLKNLLTHCHGDPALVGWINGNPDRIGQLLATVATPPVSGAELSARIDDLLLEHPGVDQAALELKLALAGNEASRREEALADHLNARLQRQTLHHIRENGGQDVLSALGIHHSRDMTFTRLEPLLAHVVTARGFEANGFNTLLVQSAWSAFLYEQGRAGNDDDLRAFRERLPEPLKNAGPEVLQGMFRLGPLSGADMRQALRFARQGEKLFAAGDVGRLMDRLCAHNPRLRAQRALTVMLRNTLNSASIEYTEENAAAYAGALKSGMAKRLEESAGLADAAKNVIGRAFGTRSGTSGQQYPAQVAAVVRHFQDVTGDLKQIQVREGELEEARQALSEYALTPPWDRLEGIKPGAEFPSESPARQAAMADPWLVLHNQGALDVGKRRIDRGKIVGEPFAMNVLALMDVLQGKVKELGTPAQQLAALNAMEIPEKLNLKRMIPATIIGHPQEPEAKAFMDDLHALLALKPENPGFQEQFNELAGKLQTFIADYRLQEKAGLILALKDTRSGLRADSGVMHVDAMMVGLKKIGLDSGRTTPDTPAHFLRLHFLTGERLFLRGQGANLILADDRAGQEKLALVKQQDALLETARANLSVRCERILTEATRMAALQAFVTQQFADFAEAGNALLDTGETGDLFRQAIRENLRENFGIEDDFAGFLIANCLTQPIKESGGESGSVFEEFCAQALPSAQVRERQKAVERQLAAPVRQLVKAEENRQRFARLLDQLVPDSTIDFTSTNIGNVSLAADAGLAQVSVAARAAATKGFALGRDAAGQYELAIHAGASGGLGIGAAGIREMLSVSLGVSVSGSESMVFTFKSREDAATFLQKINDRVWTPADLFLHCENVKRSDGLSAGVALTLQADLSKSVGNLPVGDVALGSLDFSVGFEAAGAVERTTETDATAQTIACASTVHGSIGMTVSVGRSGEKTEAEEREETAEAAASGAAAALASAATDGATEVGDDARAISTRGVVVRAGIQREEGSLQCSLAVAGTRTGTIIRSTRSDNRGTLVDASQGTNLSFTGAYARSQFEQYARVNLRLAEEQITGMLKDIGERGGEQGFTVRVEHTLTPASRAECLRAEGENRPRDAEELLRDERNYTLSSIKLEFQGRAATEAGVDINLNLGDIAHVGAHHSAAAAETFTVEYKAENAAGGTLQRLPSP